MHAVDRFAFAALDQVKLLEMRYAGGDVAMVIVLPDAIDGLAAVEKTMRAPTLGKWVDALKPAEVDVALPTFEIKPRESTPLRAHLKALGMASAFDEAKADFTGIAKSGLTRARLRVLTRARRRVSTRRSSCWKSIKAVASVERSGTKSLANWENQASAIVECVRRLLEVLPLR